MADAATSLVHVNVFLALSEDNETRLVEAADFLKKLDIWKAATPFRTSWVKRVDRISGAMTNRVYYLEIKPDEAGTVSEEHATMDREACVSKGNSEAAISRLILRIYGQGIEWMFSRPRELEWTRKLAEHEISPRWIATFSNGRIEEYIQSTTLTGTMMRHPAIYPNVARALAKFHQSLPLVNPNPVVLEDELMFRLRGWRDKAVTIYPLLRQRYLGLESSPPSAGQTPTDPLSKHVEIFSFLESNGFFKPDFMDSELIKMVFKEIDRVKSPLVLCHADLHHGNIMQRHSAPHSCPIISRPSVSLLPQQFPLPRPNDTEPAESCRDPSSLIMLVDYEYSCIAPRGFDIANYWCEWTADYGSSHPHQLAISNFPKKWQQHEFVRAYITEFPHMDESCISTIISEARSYTPICNLLWAYWAVIQAINSNINFDYLTYASQRFSLFLSFCNFNEFE